MPRYRKPRKCSLYILKSRFFLLSGVEAVSAKFTELTGREISFSAITRLNSKISQASKVLLVHLEEPLLFSLWSRSRIYEIYGVNKPEISFSAITRLNSRISQASKVLLVHLEAPLLFAPWCRSRICDIYAVNGAGNQFFGHNSAKCQDIGSLESAPYTS